MFPSFVGLIVVFQLAGVASIFLGIDQESAAVVLSDVSCVALIERRRRG